MTHLHLHLHPQFTHPRRIDVCVSRVFPLVLSFSIYKMLQQQLDLGFRFSEDMFISRTTVANTSFTFILSLADASTNGQSHISARALPTTMSTGRAQSVVDNYSIYPSREHYEREGIGGKKQEERKKSQLEKLSQSRPLGDSFDNSKTKVNSAHHHYEIKSSSADNGIND